MADAPQLSLTLLGAGQEVGRSCCVLQYRGKTIVCDAGVHPAHSGLASLPFLDELDWSKVDAILITHFHLDHAAGLTYIMEKTNFRDGKGKVYMTHPTKAVYKFIMQDFLRMSSGSTDSLFTPLDFSMSFASIITVSAHQLISPSPGFSFTPYHAGHVLGACMFLIDIAGLKILYTGDYSREEDRHLVRAEIPPVRPDVLVVESTYGVQSHEGRVEKEDRFTSLVHGIIKGGGHVLLPSFALGRAQELLLILEEYWSHHPDLHTVPIYYVSSLAKKCMAVYQTYIHTMNSNIRGRFAKQDNPFSFKYITNLPQTRGAEKRIAEGPPCVVLASPGFMDSGSSRELLELWAPDPRNAVIVTGYSIEGTMARDITNDPEEIMSLKGTPIPRRLSVHTISFSAHVDYAQNAEFIDQVDAQHVVLVHGEQTAMSRLRAALQAKYKDSEGGGGGSGGGGSGTSTGVQIHAPRNCETLKLTFRGDRVAKAIGVLAEAPPTAHAPFQGLLLAKDFTYTLLDPRDLGEFTGLSTSAVVQRQNVPLSVGIELVRWHLQGLFGSLEEGVDPDGIRTLRVMGCVDVKHTREGELCIEWESGAQSDMVADATLALVFGIESSPASVKLTAQNHSHHHHDHSHPHADALEEDEERQSRYERLLSFLSSHFGEATISIPEEDSGKVRVERDAIMNGTASDTGSDKEQGELGEEPSIIVKVDEGEARVSLVDLTVSSMNEALRSRVRSIVQLAISTINSLASVYSDTTGETSSSTLCKLNREPARLDAARFLDGGGLGGLNGDEEDEDEGMSVNKSEEVSDLDISDDEVKKEEL